MISELTKTFWEDFSQILDNHLESIQKKMSDQRAINNLNTSYNILERVVEHINDPNYIEVENEYQHKQLIYSLEDSFNCLFNSFIFDNNMNTNKEGIDFLFTEFVECIEDKKQEDIYKRYAPITKVLRYLRNVERHQRDKPIDVLTNIRTFGNIHTIHCLCILSCYAYLRVLKLWRGFY